MRGHFSRKDSRPFLDFRHAPCISLRRKTVQEVGGSGALPRLFQTNRLLRNTGINYSTFTKFAGKMNALKEDPMKDGRDSVAGAYPEDVVIW